MSKKNKLAKFKDNETFKCLFQPTTNDLLNKDYTYKGKWGKEVFKNDNPIVLELGCGKGEYTIALAEQFPNKNFIGIDIKGARLWKGAKYVNNNNIPNAIFIRSRIEFINSIFGNNEISEIWITFADPQIKKPRKCLTGSMFLNKYIQFLKDDGITHLKTDSLYLYQYTLASTLKNSIQIIHSIPDIYSLNTNQLKEMNLPDGLTTIRTFYENYYIKNGFTIKYLSVLLKKPLSPFVEPEWEEEYWRGKEAEGREQLLANKG